MIQASVLFPKQKKTSEVHTWVEAFGIRPIFWTHVPTGYSKCQVFFFVFTTKEANFHFTLFQTQL